MFRSQNKKVLQKTIIERKQYSYEYDNVTLNFTLRKDVDFELTAFRLMLNQALQDVEADIKKINEKGNL